MQPARQGSWSRACCCLACCASLPAMSTAPPGQQPSLCYYSDCKRVLKPIPIHNSTSLTQPFAPAHLPTVASPSPAHARPSCTKSDILFPGTKIPSLPSRQPTHSTDALQAFHRAGAELPGLAASIVIINVLEYTLVLAPKRLLHNVPPAGHGSSQAQASSVQARAPFKVYQLLVNVNYYRDFAVSGHCTPRRMIGPVKGLLTALSGGGTL